MQASNNVCELFNQVQYLLCERRKKSKIELSIVKNASVIVLNANGVGTNK